jgi:hypothetical protein
VRHIRRHYVDDDAIFAGRVARLGDAQTLTREPQTKK